MHNLPRYLRERPLNLARPLVAIATALALAGCAALGAQPGARQLMLVGNDEKVGFDDGGKHAEAVVAVHVTDTGRELQRGAPDDVRDALSGNLCRCTGYQNIVRSVVAAGAQT